MKKRIRQIFLKQNLTKRAIAMLMTFCMVFGFVQMPGLQYTVRADNSVLTTTVTKILYDGKELTDDTKITDGANIKIVFDWQLADTDYSTYEFYVDIDTLEKHNVTVSDSGTQILKDDGGDNVGYYEVVDGRLHIFIDSNEFLNKNGRKGGVTIDGKVDITDEGVDDGEEVTIGLGTKVYTPVFWDGITETEANVGKSISGSVYKDPLTDEFKQDFAITITPWHGDATDVRIVDTPGTALPDFENIMLNGTVNGAEVTEGPFDSMDAVNAYLAGKNVTMGKQLTVSYTATVNHKDDTSGALTNKASISYTTNKGNEITKEVSATAQATNPSVLKTGVLSNDKSKVTWTITVNVGDYEWEDINQILDEPIRGLSASNTPISTDIGDWTNKGDGTYTYTLIQDVSQAYQDSVSSAEISNKVTLTMDNGESYESTGSVYTEPGQWVSKDNAGYADGILTWTVTLGPIPEGVTNVTISDDVYTWASNKGNHVLVWDGFAVNGNTVIDSNGEKTGDYDNYIKSHDKYNPVSNIVLKDTFMAENKNGSVTLTFCTKVTDDSMLGKTYNNTIKVAYTDPQLHETKTQTDDAQYKDNSNLVTKTGTPVWGQNSIDYKIKLYMNGHTMSPGDTIIAGENFPAALKMNTSHGYTVSVENPWEGKKYSSSDSGIISYDEGTQQFTITVNEDMKDSINSEYPYLVISYRMDVANPSQFVMDGTTVFDNTATVTYNSNNIGSGTTSVTLTPQDIVFKNGRYDEETAPYVEYEVLVNKEKYDLVAGSDYISATDTLGSALSYDLSSVKVYKVGAYDWVWDELTKGTDYKYTYEHATNSLVFTKLPDSTYLKITYNARVNLAYGEAMTAENSTNSFSLNGSSSTAVDAEKGFNVVALQPSGWATSDQGKIQLYKFWTSDGEMVALDGAEFEVRKVKYDAVTGTMVDDPGKEGDVDWNNNDPVLYDCVTVSGGTVTIDGLSYARIYALTETKAASGYALRTEPYYFVLAGSSAELPPESSGIKVDAFASGATLYFENYKADKGSLEVTKSFEGIDSGDIAEALAAVSFEVKKGDVLISGGTFKGSDMTLSGGVYKKSFSNLEPGTYKVSETVSGVDGYKYKSTSYEITVGDGATSSYSGTSDLSVSGDIAAAEHIKAEFTNTYTKLAKLEIRKSVTGDAAWADIKGSIQFKVYKSSDPGTPVCTISGEDMIADGGECYFVVEDLDPEETYYVVESGADLAGHDVNATYQIASGDAKALLAGNKTGVIVPVAGETAKVKLVNAYTEHTGKLLLTKKVTGVAAWDDVKDGFDFVVKDGESGDVLYTINGAQFAYDSDLDRYVYEIPDNLPRGSYVIVETLADVEKMIITTTYDVYENSSVSVSGQSGKMVIATITGKDDKIQVDYTNKYDYKTATLVLRKTVAGDLDWSAVNSKIKFTVEGPAGFATLEIQGDDPNFLPTGDNTYTYKMNTDIPGAYTVTESFVGAEDEKYTRTTTMKVDNGAAQTTESVPLDFNVPAGATVHTTNTYKRNVGKLVLKKTLNGVNAADLTKAEQAIVFRVTDTDAGTYKEYHLSDFTKDSNGVYTYTIFDLPTGSNYHVQETQYNLNGYDVETIEYTLTAAGGTQNVVPGGQSNGTPVTIEKDKTTEVAVKDAYEVHKGSLQIVKNVTGSKTWEDIKNKISFRVTNTSTGYSETFDKDDFVLSGTSYVCKINNLPLGEYTVTEILESISGTYVTTTYKVDTAATVIGKEADATIAAKGQTVNITYTNEYETLNQSILLRKNVAGELAWANVKDSLTFKLYDEATGTLVQTVSSSAFTGPDADGYYHYRITGLTEDKYRLEEVVSGEDTFRYTRSTLIRVDSDSAKAGTVSVFDFNEATGATVTVSNSYKRNKGRLVLEKTLTGVENADLALAKDSIEFTVSPSPENAADAQKIYKLSDFIMDSDGVYRLALEDVPADNYRVKETAYGIDGYDAQSVEYTMVTASGATQSAADGLALGVAARVENGKTTKVSVTDTYKKQTGTLKITKTIKGPVTKEEAEGALRFRVTEKANGNYKDYTLKDFDTYDPATKTYTLTLDKVPGGYTVEETVSTIDGYNVTVKSSVGTDALTEGKEVTAQVDKNQTTVVNFENEYVEQKGILILNKTVTVDDVPSKEAYEVVKGEISFLITGPNGYKKTIKAEDIPYDEFYTGFSLEIKDLPIGTYTITETVKGVPGYAYVSTVNNASLEGKKATVTVKDHGTTSSMTSVTFTNDYDKVEIGKIVIKKTLKGDITKEEAEGALRFKVTSNDTGESDTYTLKDFTKNADGTYTLELDVSVGGYTVEETIYDVDGYITDSVTYSVNDGPKTSGTKTDVSVEKDATVTVDFEDAYTKDQGKIVITKTIKGDVTKEEAEGALQFKVTDTATGKSKTYTLKDFKYNKKTGVYTLELDVSSGNYTVEETIYDIKGYITSSVKYAVDGGKKKDGTKAAADVKAGESVNVDFEDVYEKNEGKLVLTKTVKGDLSWDDVKDKLKFVVKNNATDESRTYKASEFKDEDGDGVYRLVISGLTRGEYTVTEKLDDVKGYLFETTYTVDGGSKKVGTKAKVTLGKDGVQLNFVNTYSSTKGTLVITKTLKGNIDRKDAEAVLEFKVTNADTKKSKTYTLDDFVYDKDAKKYTLKLSLEPGTYKVTETVFDVDGYKLKSVTYTIGEGEKEEGNSAKAKVKMGETTKVAFVDKYYKTKTSDQTSTDTPPTSTNTSTGTSASGRETPETGDESPLALWFAMLLFGALGIGGSFYGLRKNKK